MSTRGLKLAALRLATMHAADQRWVLERVPVTLRDSLEAEVSRVVRMAHGNRGLLEHSLVEARSKTKALLTNSNADAVLLPDEWRQQLDTCGLPPKLAAALETVAAPGSFARHLQNCEPAAVEFVE